MINLHTLYEKVCADVNTHQSGHMRPVRNFVNWVNDVQFSLFEEYIAALGKSDQVAEMLKPFAKYDVDLAASDVGRLNELFVKQPDDFSHFIDAKAVKQKYDNGNSDQEDCDRFKDEDDLQLDEENIVLSTISLERVDSQRWGSMMSHVTKRPTDDNPKITEHSGGFKIAPKGFSSISLSYYRIPQRAVLAYRITNPGELDEYIEFQEIGTKHLEWPETMTNEFVNRISKKFSKYTRDMGMYQISENDRVKTM